MTTLPHYFEMVKVSCPDGVVRNLRRYFKSGKTVHSVERGNRRYHFYGDSVEGVFVPDQIDEWYRCKMTQKGETYNAPSTIPVSDTKAVKQQKKRSFSSVKLHTVPIVPTMNGQTAGIDVLRSNIGAPKGAGQGRKPTGEIHLTRYLSRTGYGYTVGVSIKVPGEDRINKYIASVDSKAAAEALAQKAINHLKDPKNKAILQQIIFEHLEKRKKRA